MACVRRCAREEVALKEPEVRTLVRNFAIEVLLYGVLVLGYFFLVLRFLGQPLYELYTHNLVVYAFAALALIVAQGAVLEIVTSFLIGRLGLDRLG
jgi:hypothetical protein